MKKKWILEKIKVALRRIFSGRACLFAECCCGLRGPMYVGELDRHHAVELTDFGCYQCMKFARGCWGPRLKSY